MEVRKSGRNSGSCLKQGRLKNVGKKNRKKALREERKGGTVGRKERGTAGRKGQAGKEVE